MAARLLAGFAAVLVFSGCDGPRVSQAAEVDEDGFVALFNGEDLKGWQTSGNWVVEDDGVLACKPKPGKRGIFSYRLFLWTKLSFRDIVLDFEFKLAEGGDSSVFLRSQSLGRFIEVELTDSSGRKGPLTMDHCGAVQNVIPPSKNAAKPAGQWNHMTIHCKGNLVQVTLNGEQVVDLDYEKIEKTVPAVGKIGFQDWGHPVWLRKIRIKPLK